MPALPAQKPRRPLRTLVCAMPLLLAACGGGGDAGTPPPLSCSVAGQQDWLQIGAKHGDRQPGRTSNWGRDDQIQAAIESRRQPLRIARVAAQGLLCREEPSDRHGADGENLVE